MAALIGAGTAAVVTIGSQFIAHALAVRRDKSWLHRDRLLNVVTEVTTAL